MKETAQKGWLYVKSHTRLMMYVAVLALLLPLTVFLAGQQQERDIHAAPVPLAIDVQSGKSQSDPSNQITSSAITTNGGNEMVVVFLSSDGSLGSAQSFASVIGGGLTFSLARRANGQRGTSEIWYAYAPNQLRNVQIVATRQTGSYRGMIRVVTFMGAKSTIGATGAESANAGVPHASVTTTAAGSMVLGIGNDSAQSASRHAGPNQRITQQYLPNNVNRTFWTQQQRATLPGVGSLVTLDAQPSSTSWNMAAVEVLQAEQAMPTTTTQATYSLWSDAAVPANPADQDTQAVEIGVKFKSDVSGKVLGLKYYKSATNTGVHVGNLWSATGQLLTTATFTNESASGWQRVSFATPVTITANTVYVASYHTNVGRYAGDNNYFNGKGVDNGPLHALANGTNGGNGVYTYGAASAFPKTTYQASNYWVDVIFQSDQPGGRDVTTVPATSTPTNVPGVTATPTRVPTPTPTFIPPVSQSSGNRPSAANTGYPHGLSGDTRTPVTLTTYTGPSTITTAGTVIDSKRLGCITIKAANVTIRRSLVECDDYYPVWVVSGNLTIEDTEISASGGAPTSGVAFDNYVARRLNVHGSADGLKAQTNVTIEDSWIHDLWLKPGDHADGVQQDGGGSNVTVRGNFIDVEDHGLGHGEMSNAAVQVDKGSSSNFVVEGNWFTCQGAGYCVNLRAVGGTGDKVINNRIIRGGGNTIYTEGSVTVSGNVFDATNQPVN